MRKILIILGLLIIARFGFTQPAPHPVLDMAEDIGVDASGFSGNLSSADDDVQKALDTIDGLSLGESNTASNVGTAGTGVFKQKTDLNLEFYKLNSINNLLTIGLDGTDKIDFTINETNIDHSNLSNLNWAAAGHTIDAALSPDGDNTRDLGATTTARWKDIYLAGSLKDDTNSVTIANLKTAYDHSQDNSQAHTDYLINNGNDVGAGIYTFDGLTLGQNELITLGSATIKHDGTDVVVDDSMQVDGPSTLSTLNDLRVTDDAQFDDEVNGSLTLIASGSEYVQRTSDSYIRTAGITLGSNTRGFVMPVDGSITKIGCTVYFSTASAGATWRMELRKNGANVVSCNVDSEATSTVQECYVDQGRRIDTFAAGDVLSFYANEIDGTAGIDEVTCACWGYFND